MIHVHWTFLCHIRFNLTWSEHALATSNYRQLDSQVQQFFKANMKTLPDICICNTLCGGCLLIEEFPPKSASNVFLCLTSLWQGIVSALTYVLDICFKNTSIKRVKEPGIWIKHKESQPNVVLSVWTAWIYRHLVINWCTFVPFCLLVIDTHLKMAKIPTQSNQTKFELYDV